LRKTTSLISQFQENQREFTNYNNVRSVARRLLSQRAARPSRPYRAEIESVIH
jgi:hypothetical protein